MTTTPDLNTVRERHRLGAAVPWELRQELIRASGQLALGLNRADDAAQVGSDLPVDLRDRLNTFLEVRARYSEAVEVSRGRC